ncbi:hypothetical protein NQ317_011565 [Molorchus minor]|uniref:Elongation of very long chain fatty acids protein n=1 Tax=Molorchus minor TaxID=1323400 RepID=A0ABQ9JSF3_9CUCU|nr:hypothetical protein NQ317_011565 [Molorchus minor]
MLLANVLTPLIISVVYHRLVYKWGPKFMEMRQPYNLRIMLIAYNLIQIVINVYCTHISLKRVIVQNWKCAPVDYSNSPEALDEIHATKVYYFLKLLDLTDTVFFLLRKSYRQITFLHTYHHIGMILTPWIGLRFIPGGHGVWISLINSFVHAMMYSYYLLTAIDERWKKNIELKKFLTQMQIVSKQICLNSTHKTA